MSKDWIGNNKAIYGSLLGASNHSDDDREENDYYASHPETIYYLQNLIDNTNLHITKDDKIWEPCNGEGHLSNELEKLGYKNIIRTDLIDRGDPKLFKTLDFLNCNELLGDIIITNPPYKYVREVTIKALRLNCKYLCQLLKITFLETEKRYNQIFSKRPPKYVGVFTKRTGCYKNGEIPDLEIGKGGGAACYCWFIWEKDFKGDTVIKWIKTE